MLNWLSFIVLCMCKRNYVGCDVIAALTKKSINGQKYGSISPSNGCIIQKTVEFRIMKFLPFASPIPLVFAW